MTVNAPPPPERRTIQRDNRFTMARRAPRGDRGLDGSAPSPRVANTNAFANWDCSCGYTNHRLSKECRSCHKPATPSKPDSQYTFPPRSTRTPGIPYKNSGPASDWRSRTTGSPITRQDDLRLRDAFPVAAPDTRLRDTVLDDLLSTKTTQNMTVPNINLNQSDENRSDLAQNWRHIRRKSAEAIPLAADVKAPVEPSSAMKNHNPGASKNGTETSILELERLGRLEKTKNGRYIGLHADRIFPKTVGRHGSENNTGQIREGLNAESMSASKDIQDLDYKPSSKINPRTLQPYKTKGDEPADHPVAASSAFNSNKGWSRWEPTPVESSRTSAPTWEEGHSSTGSRVNQLTRDAEEVGANTPTRGETKQQSPPLSHSERISAGAEPAKGRWKSWSPPLVEERTSQNFKPDGGRASAEKQYISDPKDASFESAAVNPVADQYSERSDMRKPRKEKKKSRTKDNESIDQLQLANRSFKAESSTYSKGRDKARKKQAKFQSEFEEDEDEGAAAKIERRQQRRKERAMQRRAAPPTPIYLPEFISVSNLAAVLRVRVEDFASRMQTLGFEEINNDHVLDAEVAGLIAVEFNFEPIIDRGVSEDLKARPPAEDKSVLPPRPPVVTIMGHVDHGKTTLLDWLRKSSVAASEFGGITQHIGAFSVQMPSGKIITFLDTPGHAAFLSMRQRGANVTDIVILVVAADDSVKPQTIEAIKHAQAAKVPIIVAVNKIDKEDSNVDRVKQDLARYGVEIEDYGGDTQVVCVSGKTGQGMEELEDAAVALADILDMRAETDGQAEGWVLEATTKKAGRVATVLVRRGTLRSGDVIVAGTTWARVRSLKNEAGVQVPSAGPGTPVEIDGWREQPAAGDEVLQAVDEQQAKSVVELRLEDLERSQMATDMTAVNEARRIEQEKREAQDKLEEEAREAGEDTPAAVPVEEPPKQPGIKEVFFLIKGDVSGSVEAVLDSISALGNSEVRPHVLRSGVGPVSEFDIEHAAAAKGQIIAFNVSIEPAMRRLADQSGVRILEENIIYRLVDDVKAKLSEMLPPLVTQRVLGEAEVAQVFEINVKGRVMVPVAGCRVRNGVVSKSAKVRVLRGKEVVYDGMLLLSFPPTTGAIC